MDAFPEKHRRADRAAAEGLARIEESDLGGRAGWFIASRGSHGILTPELARRVASVWARIARPSRVGGVRSSMSVAVFMALLGLASPRQLLVS